MFIKNKVQKYYHLPIHSIIARELKGDVDYIDSFKFNYKNSDNHSADYLTALLFTSLPGWILALFKLRDFIVKPFGLQTGLIPDPQTLSPSLNYKIGEKAVFFTVIDRSESEIVMAEDDKHLYFRTSVLINKNSEKNIDEIFLTTLVQFHNFGGKLYFLPVKPFHKLIIKTLLKNFLKAH